MAVFGWDPQQYGRYADHRSRPFFELVGRVNAPEPHHVIDLGCGPGELTATLAQRWPGAKVTGVDNSESMLDAAAQHAIDGRLSFAAANLDDFTPGPKYDVVVSNAAYQWVDNHQTVLSQIARDIPLGGWLAVQVPGNFDAPSHRIIRALTAEPRWQEATGGLQLRVDPVIDAAGYGNLFAAEGLQVDTWETTYNQVLGGESPVLEWVKGTAVRPVLDRLDAAQQADFLSELGTNLQLAYPQQSYRTVFPFRRIFAVGHRANPDSR